jgi:hypothetical protein
LEKDEKRKKKDERGGGIIKMCVKNLKINLTIIVSINIVVVAELKKIQTLDGQKRDGPLWAVHI